MAKHRHGLGKTDTGGRCPHRAVEYKAHLDRMVCRCGLVRDVVERGQGTQWRKPER